MKYKYIFLLFFILTPYSLVQGTKSCPSNIIHELTAPKKLTRQLESALAQIKKIPRDQIRLLSDAENPNKSHKAHSNIPARFINYQEKTQFFKILPKDEGIIEAAKFQRLNELGLGPKFEGVVELPNDQIGIITETIKGTLFKCCDLFGEEEIIKASISRKTVEQIRRAGKIMEENNISPVDLQFIIDEKGNAVVIDPGEFIFKDIPNVFKWTPEKGKASVAEDNANFEMFGLDLLKPGTQEWEISYYPPAEAMARYLERFLNN